VCSFTEDLLYLSVRVWESCNFLRIATVTYSETAGTFLAQEAANWEFRTVTAAVVMLAAVCVTFLWQHHGKCWECWSDCCEKYRLFEFTLGYDMTQWWLESDLMLEIGGLTLVVWGGILGIGFRYWELWVRCWELWVRYWELTVRYWELWVRYWELTVRCLWLGLMLGVMGQILGVSCQMLVVRCQILSNRGRVFTAFWCAVRCSSAQTVPSSW
jgi:hypothetical protein